MSGLRPLARLYLRTMRVSATNQLQYRASNIVLLIGMVAEPVVYLVVWRTVAENNGGAVGGFTTGGIAAYYLVWTLVRNMNATITPYEFESRIRSGQMSGLLLRPVHPIHCDLAEFAGWKAAILVFWLPIAFVLAVLFQPTFEVTWLGVVTFVPAVCGAFLIRSLYLWLLGLSSFWITRAGALFELVVLLELLLSGRMVPLALLPEWARAVSAWLPFQWTFSFPIEALVGRRSPDQLAWGLATQLLWVVAGSVAVALIWRRAVRRYTAVGN